MSAVNEEAVRSCSYSARKSSRPMQIGVRSLPDTSRCFLIKHGTDSVVARLNLAGEPELLTILSGRERTVRILDDIRAAVGDDPAQWLPRLLEQA